MINQWIHGTVDCCLNVLHTDMKNSFIYNSDPYIATYTYSHIATCMHTFIHIYQYKMILYIPGKFPVNNCTLTIKVFPHENFAIYSLLKSHSLTYCNYISMQVAVHLPYVYTVGRH